MGINRFDLEQEIMNCWKVIDDIDLLAEGVCEGTLTQDQIANILIGMKDLYNMKFEKTFGIFEECISKGKI